MERRRGSLPSCSRHRRGLGPRFLGIVYVHDAWDMRQLLHVGRLSHLPTASRQRKYHVGIALVSILHFHHLLDCGAGMLRTLILRRRQSLQACLGSCTSDCRVISGELIWVKDGNPLSVDVPR